MITNATSTEQCKPARFCEGSYALHARGADELWETIAQINTKGGMSPTQAVFTLTRTAHWLVERGIRETRIIEMPDGAHPRNFTVIAYSHS